MMDIEQAIRICESQEPEEYQHVRRGICPECRVDMIIHHSIFVCPECGLSDVSNPILVNNDRWLVNKSVYLRRSYFVERLNLIAGFKQCTNPDYKTIIRRLRRCNFKSLRKLRHHMKRLGYNAYYKYIYNIYYDIKKQRLITLTRSDIKLLVDRFAKVQSRFNRETHNRKNFFSYSTLIYLLLKEMNIDGYNKILLPRQSRKMMKLISRYCL